MFTVNAVRAGPNCISLLAPYLHNSKAMHLLLVRPESNVASARATPWSWRTFLMLATSLREATDSSSGDWTVSNSLTGSGMAEAMEMRETRMKGFMMVCVRRVDGKLTSSPPAQLTLY